MRRRLLALVCLACAITPALTAAPRAERINLYYGMAEGNYLIGDLSGATRGIEQMLRLDPNHIPALKLRIQVLLDQNRPESALKVAHQLVDLEPADPTHRLREARILGQMRRLPEATALIEALLTDGSISPEQRSNARQMLGLLRMAEGQWDEAALAFQGIAIDDPVGAEASLRLSSEAFLEKAGNALQTGDSNRALEAVDQAIALYKNQDGRVALEQSRALRLMRARLLAQIGREADAIADLQALNAQQPDHFEALITLASLYAAAGQWTSLDGLIPSIAARAELADIALYLEGRSALAKNRIGTARAKFEAAIEALPSEAESLRRTLFFYRGICLQRLGRQDEAETAILQAIDAGFRPETPEEALTTSRTLLRAKRAENAIPLLEAITLNRIAPDAQVWAMLGHAHLANQTPALALSAFNESLQIKPNQAETRALRGSLLRKFGDLEGALNDYQTARRLSPKDPALAYAEGLVHIQLGQIAQAEDALHFTSDLFESRPGIALLHALLAHSVQRDRRARASLRFYQNAVKETPNPTAHYLAHLLFEEPMETITSDPITRYYLGQDDRKAALDTAGQADTPEQARRQICTTAFWLAQFERKHQRPKKARELLQIALDAGHPDLPEFQIARWQWLRSSDSAGGLNASQKPPPMPQQPSQVSP